MQPGYLAKYTSSHLTQPYEEKKKIKAQQLKKKKGDGERGAGWVLTCDVDSWASRRKETTDKVKVPSKVMPT